MTAALALRDLRVRRGRRDVLHVAALYVEPGETVAVLGPNGAGKSTLLLAAALLIPASGDIAVFGEPAGRGRGVRLRRMTSTVFQDAGLLDMSARRNIEQALAIHSVPRGERAERARYWLDRLGVSARAEARPHQLSGGEAQRVSIARALAVTPRFLFLDEPFSGLDFATRARMVGEMRALLLETGVAALLATHDHAEAAVLADRVVVLVDGRVAQEGATAEVLRRPATAEVARFLGFSVLDWQAATALGLGREGPAGGGQAVAVPPGAVALLDAGDDESADALDARVVAVEGAAGGVRLALDVAGAALAAEVGLEALHVARWAPGDRVRVRVDPARVVWL